MAVTDEQRSYAQDIAELVRGRLTPRILKDKIEDYHENDIADALVIMTKAERQRLYRILDMEMLSDIFGYLDEEQFLSYFQEMEPLRQAQLISKMDSDHMVDVLRTLEKKDRDLIVSLMDDVQRHEIAMLSVFDEDQIGSRMTTDFVTLKKSVTVPEGMKQVIAQAADNDNITTIYVVDADDVFYGAISLKALIIARKDDPFEELITTSYPFVYAKEDIDSCLEWIKDYSENSIPALDENNHILGIITSQNLVEVVDEEMGEDYARLAGLAAEEDLREPVSQSVKKRIPWLVVLLGLAMIVSSVVGIFETVVAELTVLMLFQSLVLDMAGNVGTQSLAVTIRVLADDTVSSRQKIGLVWKESRVGLLNGLLMGCASFALAGLYLHFVKGDAWAFSFAIAACIALALLIAMLVSSVVGTTIPIFFKKMGVDPAVASGPLITTLNDLTAVIAYYGLAWLLLIQMMHY